MTAPTTAPHDPIRRSGPRGSRRTLALAAALAASGTAHAADARSEPDQVIVISATRSATPISRVPASVSVVGQEDFATEQAGTVADVLRRLPAVNKYGQQPDPISPAAKRGEDLFYDEELECSHCHGGFLFNDNVQHTRLKFPEIGFHNTGLYNVDGRGAYPASNRGLRAITGDPADEGKFRTPTLRNVAVTAPYMHDGSVRTLRDAIAGHYAIGGRAASDGQPPSPLRDPLIEGFALTPAQLDDVVAFLESLTDQKFLRDPAHADPWKTAKPASVLRAARTTRATRVPIAPSGDPR